VFLGTHISFLCPELVFISNSHYVVNYFLTLLVVILSLLLLSKVEDSISFIHVFNILSREYSLISFLFQLMKCFQLMKLYLKLVVSFIS
jgi:hypothetical protein